KQADKEVEHVLAEKDQYPEWKIENFHVYPDPRARFADPTNPDRPPMPPDDPAAWDLSPHPQKPGKAGTKLVEGTGYLELLAAWDAETGAERGEQSLQALLQSSTVLVGSGGEAPTDSTGRRDLFGSSRPEAYELFRLKLEQAVELGLINSREYQD